MAELQKRERLMVDIRRRLYRCQLPALQDLARYAKPEASIADLDADQALQIIERRLELSIKDEDAGVSLLVSVLDCLKGPAVKPEQEQQAVPIDNGRYRKELRISGQIGGKESVPFISLARQIDTASKRGFSDTEIVDAIIRATQPGSSLRGYLEGRSDLNLATVRSILRGHYKEKSATELYKEMSNIAQEPKEDPTDFLMRALDLRQRLIFTNQAQNSGLSYTPELVQGMFLHALYTGFANDTVRHEMLPVLESENVQDEHLIEALNAIILREAERRSKFDRSSHRAGRVNVVETADIVDTPEKKAKPVKEGALATELRELRAAVAEIQNHIDKTLQPRDDPGTKSEGSRRRTASGCPACQTAGTGNTCRHCWKCGSGDHFKIGCRAGQGKVSENGVGLLPPGK